MRLLSQASQVENIRLQVGMLGDSDFSKITVAAGRVANLPMTFFGGLRSWETIKALLRALKLREPNLSLVVVDYAQLLSAPVAENKRYQEVSKISSEAKGLALELNAALMLLSQLSRALPEVIDKLTPDGKLPKEADLLPGPEETVAARR